MLPCLSRKQYRWLKRCKRQDSLKNNHEAFIGVRFPIPNIRQFLQIQIDSKFKWMSKSSQPHFHASHHDVTEEGYRRAKNQSHRKALLAIPYVCRRLKAKMHFNDWIDNSNIQITLITVEYTTRIVYLYFP